MIGVVIPTRGLICGETMATLLPQLLPGDHVEVMVGRPIPDCYNIGIDRCLEYSGALTHIWIVEDDISLPPIARAELLLLDADIALLDYCPRGQPTQRFVTHNRDGTFAYGPIGCAMIRRTALEALTLGPRRWVQCASYTWRHGYVVPADHPVPGNGHDVDLYQRALRRRLTIAVHPRLVAGHIEARQGERRHDAVGTVCETTWPS